MNPIRRFVLLLCACAALGGFAESAAAQQFGTIAGKFVFKGKAPVMGPVAPPAFPAGCGPAAPPAPVIIIGPKGEIADVVIFAVADEKNANIPIAPIHARYNANKGRNVALTNRACQFVPHVQTCWTAESLLLVNADPIPHNCNGTPFENAQFNPMLPPRGRLAAPLPNGEKVPFKVTCNIHPWMTAYVLVRPDPYMAVSDKKGEFEIADIPAGMHTFRIWHEALGYLKIVTLNGVKSENNRGYHKINVAAGQNALNEITIDAADYTKQLKKIK